MESTHVYKYIHIEWLVVCKNEIYPIKDRSSIQETQLMRGFIDCQYNIAINQKRTILFLPFLKSQMIIKYT